MDRGNFMNIKSIGGFFDCFASALAFYILIWGFRTAGAQKTPIAKGSVNKGKVIVVYLDENGIISAGLEGQKQVPVKEGEAEKSLSMMPNCSKSSWQGIWHVYIIHIPVTLDVF
jgi:hypothetical protein